jgi:hypothetical protein
MEKGKEKTRDCLVPEKMLQYQPKFRGSPRFTRWTLRVAPHFTQWTLRVTEVHNFGKEGSSRYLSCC